MFSSSAGFALLVFMMQVNTHRVTVPAQLAERTSNPELSGIAWAGALSRYLVVSDDTGDKEDKTQHAPWAFAISPSGVMDADPVPIIGIKHLNDPESICPGPAAGQFFITTSHSADKHGRHKPSRQRLLLTELRGRELHILGEVDLTTARSGSGGGLLDIAGLDPQGKLDIEAIGFRGSDLYLGLKAPLTAGGAAVLLKFSQAAAALRAGKIPKDAITKYREVSLCLPHDGATVCEGVSDMLFLPDGTLALTGNAPKGGKPDGGGALWAIHNPDAPGSQAAMVYHFEGLKPEGLTLTPDGRSLVVVFDRDREQPMWVRWALPI